MMHIKEPLLLIGKLAPMAKSSANGLVGTGFASQYWLHPRASFKCPMGRCKATTPSSFSLTSNSFTTNYLLSKIDNPVDNWSVCP